MSYGTITTAMIQGLDVHMIQVEADVSNGLPVFHMVGYLSSEVKEASERVRTAIKNSGIRLQAKKAVINLSPASLRKRGSSYDLPIAVAILVSALEVLPDRTNNAIFAGELSLEGKVMRIKGVLPMVLKAKEEGYKTFFLPVANVAEACLVDGIEVYGVESLSELCDFLNEVEEINMSNYSPPIISNTFTNKSQLDFNEIQGQIAVKRATEIAVAGGHNMLLIGPPGSGKTMIASRIPSISPPLTQEECLEITKIYSIMGLLSEDQPLITERPYRVVHHTATRAALIGGGIQVTPGEISLAHHGVLFLDELPEFPRHVIEVLRQPLEEKKVHVARNNGSYTYPANFMLVGAMNPCPCGAFPDLNRCTCTDTQIQQYISKISQPFLDRIDICVEAPKIGYEDLTSKQNHNTSNNEPTSQEIYNSKHMRVRIEEARKLQRHRLEQFRYTQLSFHDLDQISSLTSNLSNSSFTNSPSIDSSTSNSSSSYSSLSSSPFTNSSLTIEEIRQFCALDTECSLLMKQAFHTLNLTARSYHKILKVARTIADLDQSVVIEQKHLTEAISYRGIDKRYWGGIQ